MSSLLPCNPECNVTVRASAGTGKTWLLVSRILRLLLAGTPPGRILAITFTRKAAGEILDRLLDRLFRFAAAEESELEAQLLQIGAPVDPNTRSRARALFETVLTADPELRATTFHAFCHDILRRFSLEADVSAGFELMERSSELEESAWDALIAEATRRPDSPEAGALEELFRITRSLTATRGALRQFLGHRSDWWAYTEGQPDPLRAALEHLDDALGPARDVSTPQAEFFCAQRLARLQALGELLVQDGTKASIRNAEHIALALSRRASPAEAFATAAGAFLRSDGEPRVFAASKARERRLGVPGQARLIELQGTLLADYLAARAETQRCEARAVNDAWLRAGSALLSHYDRLKRERRVLDFADLEWKTYVLLNRAEHAHWVQYKLDARVDHLLVDEFQDTNPTQWRLLLPLMEEMAAGETERCRSVFMVGDSKQSIFGFRRAEPALVAQASAWTRRHLDAADFSLSRSWRSSPAILDVVNRLFTGGPLADFEPHSSHRDDYWGRVELLPLASASPDGEAAEQGHGELRNPLLEPRPYREPLGPVREGEAIARQIRALMEQHTPVAQERSWRPMRWDDVMVLVRSRTHISAIEQALRASGIPYLGTDRGTLLHATEALDLEALLTVLVTPYDDLALARVMRSPIFAASDEHLQTLAQTPGETWWARLEHHAGRTPEGDILAHIHATLTQWRALVDNRPVHDLLDYVYLQADIPARYAASVSPHLAGQVRGNLTRFLELALEVDSGRYPSLTRFLFRLGELRASGTQAPDEAPTPSRDARVRVLTVHAAKGLEAPVVFLADTCRESPAQEAWRPLVDWPAGDPRPQRLLLVPPKGRVPGDLDEALAARRQREHRDEMNLLYVALTRARHLLYVSGSLASHGRIQGWYGWIVERLGLEPGEGTVLARHGTPPRDVPTPRPAQEALSEAEPALGQPIAGVAPAPAHPSDAATTHRADENAASETGRRRGIALHSMLDALSASRRHPFREDRIRAEAARAAGLFTHHPDIKQWWQEAQAVVGDPRLADYYDPSCYEAAWNEIPIAYEQAGRSVIGVIDRLVLTSANAIILDYKTNARATPAQLPALAQPHQPQMRLYAKGVQRLWPGRRVRAILLFTACRGLHEVGGIT